MKNMKNDMPKMLPTFDIGKKREKSAPRALFLGGPGERGLAEFRLNSRLTSTLRFTRPAPQAGCGGSNLVQNGARGAEGSIVSGSGVDFGAIGKSVFLYRQKNDHKSRKFGPKCATGRFCRSG